MTAEKLPYFEFESKGLGNLPYLKGWTLIKRIGQLMNSLVGLFHRWSLLALFIQPNAKIESYQFFKEITDVYLSKHKIPYTRETSGSSVVYRCPFVDSCAFSIRGGISRSKVPGKKGISTFIVHQ